MDDTDDRETSRHRSRGGGSRLATLAGAALLVLIGFFLGLVAGAMFEEPRLVIDHVAGNTTDVPLDAPGLAPGTPGVAPAPEAGAEQAAAPAPVEAPPAAAPEPLGLSGARAPEPVAAVAAAPAPAPTPAVSSPPPPGFEIQVGAFGERGAADVLVQKLQRAGYQARIVPTEGAARFKVRVGPYATRADAESRARSLKAEHRLPTWVVATGAG
jgi:cell division septation protein DedD